MSSRLTHKSAEKVEFQLKSKSHNISHNIIAKDAAHSNGSSNSSTHIHQSAVANGTSHHHVEGDVSLLHQCPVVNGVRNGIKVSNSGQSKGGDEEPMTKMRRTESWKVESSFLAKKTVNPIRSLVDQMKLTPNPEKQMIALSIGDPTTFENLNPPDEAKSAVIEIIRGKKHHGYAPSIGYEEARQAVAKHYSSPQAELTSKDVILTNGCSSAIDLCISCLCGAGSTLLIPRPGFSLYKTLALGLGIDVQYYDLRPDQDWEVNLDQLSSLMSSDKVSAVVVNNPSNPCGSNYSAKHLKQIITVAETHKVPIIADEIYADFVFSGEKFVPMATLTKTVPILSCGGLTKKWIVPGWRMGWILIHDRDGIFEAEIRPGLISLSQRILGPNTLVQAAIPEILKGVPDRFFEEYIGIVEKNAKLCFSALSTCPGLTPVRPRGAMYLMVGVNMEKFPGFKSDVDFTEKMVTEQSVFCLPASVFEYPNFFRVVLTVPEEMMIEALGRIKEFCVNHFVA